MGTGIDVTTVSWPPYFEDGSNAELKENVLSILKERMFSVVAPPTN